MAVHGFVSLRTAPLMGAVTGLSYSPTCAGCPAQCRDRQLSPWSLTVVAHGADALLSGMRSTLSGRPRASLPLAFAMTQGWSGRPDARVCVAQPPRVAAATIVIGSKGPCGPSARCHGASPIRGTPRRAMNRLQWRCSRRDGCGGALARPTSRSLAARALARPK